VPLGGRNEQVTLVVPSSHPSPILRLAASLRDHIHHHTLEALTMQHLSRGLPKEVHDQIQQAVMACLRRVTVIRIKPRWASLYLALQSVLHPPGLTLGEELHRRVDMVFIDGFADGFWPERWSGEERGEKRHDRVKGQEDVGLREVLGVLESLRRDMGTIVGVSLQGLWVSGHFGRAEVAIERNVQSASAGAVPRTIWTRQGRPAAGVASKYPNHTDRSSGVSTVPGRYHFGRCSQVNEDARDDARV
jgi:hypothetical protein